MDLKELIAAAKGDQPVDYLFTNARIINVYSGEIVSGHIAVSGGHFVVSMIEARCCPRKQKNRYVAPGFIDSHVHIESSMASVEEFAKAVVCKGTTTVVADPHEIANVMGTAGIDYMLRASENLPVNIFFTLPSCVPATNMETAGAVLGPETIKSYLVYERIVGLGEMMNFPGVIFGDDAVIQKITDTLLHKKSVDGHCPGLTGKDLNAYVSAGITSDHECTTADEAMEKLRLGMHIMIREGTGAKNLKDLLPVINERTADRIMWCTDDRHPHDICAQGHIDFMIRTAILNGIDPITAIQIGTLHPARYFGLKQLGAIAPGHRADMMVFSDLKNMTAEEVYCGGSLVAADGSVTRDIFSTGSAACPSAINVKSGSIDFTIPAAKKKIRVIELVPEQISTRQAEHEASIEKGFAVSDTSTDILKIAVVERHKATGNIGKGFVSGFRLKKGAFAGSVAHDSHNIIVVGTCDEDMKIAVERIIEMNGGLSAVNEQTVIADLPLPIAGLMSVEPLEIVRNQMDAMTNAARTMGAVVPDPFMILSFLALPVIPELKLTDRGLFDVKQFAHVSLFVD